MLLNKDKYKEFWRLIVKLVQKKDVFFNASAITFNLFICAIPFTLLLISIIGYVLSYEDAFQEIIRYGQELFPSFTYESQSGDVYRGAITLETLLKPLIGVRRVFGLVGVVILVFFAQGLFHTVKHVVFEVFDIEDRKHPVFEMVYNFFTFGVVGGVFIFFSLVIYVVSFISFDQITVPFTNRIIQLSWVFEFLNIVIPVAFTLLLFYIIFRYISEKRMQPRVALVGALVYTVLFEIAKYGVGVYLDYAFRAYRYFYQGYAIGIVIGIWAFYSAALLVVATIVARAYQEVFLHKHHLEENPYTSIS
ncbi:YihY/virulence factor BrkB family protein [Aliifodinibius sp. S!AR15-10]|uniref:YihY/virulence factor BrkB family protein n=1 Tax=Aliifodinibius sp. S!AR15-10 TaxID=2950437 RepID=UPI0028709AF3|nr:YihY/virulence factor BrkB family protein [Aliifodinibius sp. S!AR15-10]